MNAEGTCPICKIPLTINSDHDQIQFCSSCKREFWPVAVEQQKTLLEEYDIETVGSSESGGGEGPVLMCDDSDLRTWPKGHSHRKKDYLAEHFPNTTIETREYIPT